MGTFKNPDVWKQNLAYQIGDFVLYNGTVYMAIKPVPAGTEMSTDYWYAFTDGAIVPTGEISITENGEVDVAAYATANVNVEGGGGDFTTVTVTFVNNTSQMMMPFRPYITIPSITESGIAPEVRDSGEYTTALYKGCTFGGVVAPNISLIDVTTEGDATWDSNDSYLTITGDCTITIKEHGSN